MIGTPEDKGEFQHRGCHPEIVIVEREPGRGAAEVAEAASEAGNTVIMDHILWNISEHVCLIAAGKIIPI